MASYQKLKSGWEVRVPYKTEDGKHKQKVRKGFRTKKEAEQEAIKLLLEIKHPEEIAKSQTLREFVESWAKVYKEPHVTMRTWTKYKVIFNNIDRFFGKTPISKITRTSYQIVFNELSEKYTQETIHALHVAIHGAIKVAVRDHILADDFADGAIIKSSKPDRPIEEKFLEEDEYKHVIEVTQSRFETPSYFLIYLIAVTGLRLSEALGLTWEDVDFETGYLTVNKNYDMQFEKDFSATKTESSIREIPISEHTVELLKNYHENIWQTNDENRLCPNISSNGAIHTLRNIVGRKVHTHSLRHTFASYLIFQGVELITISKILGHKDLTITLQVYAHQIDSLKEKNHNKVKDIFNSL